MNLIRAKTVLSPRRVDRLHFRSSLYVVVCASLVAY